MVYYDVTLCIVIDVTLLKKIELKIEHDVDKTDIVPKIGLPNNIGKSKKYGVFVENRF